MKKRTDRIEKGYRPKPSQQLEGQNPPSGGSNVRQSSSNVGLLPLLRFFNVREFIKDETPSHFCQRKQVKVEYFNRGVRLFIDSYYPFDADNIGSAVKLARHVITKYPFGQIDRRYNVLPDSDDLDVVENWL